MPVKSLLDFLDSNQVKYILCRHSPAYTAQEIAQSAHICGKILAKTVIILMDGKMVMALMPANTKIDWDQLIKEMDTDFIEMADENEFKDAFPGCEIGAMPPFGNLFNMTVYMDDALARNEEIAFCAGSHSEIIRMVTEDFMKCVKPVVISGGFVKSMTPPMQRNRPGRQQAHRHD